MGKGKNVDTAAAGYLYEGMLSQLGGFSHPRRVIGPLSAVKNISILVMSVSGTEQLVIIIRFIVIQSSIKSAVYSKLKIFRKVLPSAAKYSPILIM